MAVKGVRVVMKRVRRGESGGGGVRVVVEG